MSFRGCATLTATIFAVGALLSLPTGCLQCTLAACASGFVWEAEAEHGALLAVGEYQLSVTLDGATYQVTCTVAEPDEGPSECSPPVAPADGRFTLDLDFFSSDGPPRGFSLFAVDPSATQRSGGLGPQTVEIAVRYAGAPLFAVDYEVEYEVDEAFWGDTRCGACELLEAYTYIW